MRGLLLTAGVAACLAAGAAVARADEEHDQVIENGSTVSVEYTLKLEDGSTADTNVGGDPLVYEHGASQMLPAFEEQLTGMEVDESKKFSLTPAEGYGEVDPALRQSVDADLVPEDGRRAGAQLVSEDPSGQRHLVRVHSVQDDKVVLDLNHPLAGEALHFDVKILGIE